MYNAPSSASSYDILFAIQILLEKSFGNLEETWKTFWILVNLMRNLTNKPKPMTC